LSLRPPNAERFLTIYSVAGQTGSQDANVVELIEGANQRQHPLVACVAQSDPCAGAELCL